MPDQLQRPTRYNLFRRFIKISKAFLSLVYLVLKILEKLIDLIG